MRAFRSRFESGRSGVLSETSEQPATHTAAARIAGRRRPMKTMCVLSFMKAYTTTRCYVNASGHYVSVQPMSEVTPRCDGAALPAETVMMLTCAPPHSGLCINRAPPSVSQPGGARCRREETAAVLKEEFDEQSSHARSVQRIAGPAGGWGGRRRPPLASRRQRHQPCREAQKGVAAGGVDQRHARHTDVRSDAAQLAGAARAVARRASTRELSSHLRSSRVERHRRGSQVEEELPASAPAMGWSHPAPDSAQSRHLRRVHQIEAVIDLEVHFPQYARELRIGKPVHRRIVRVVNQVAAMFHDPGEDAVADRSR